MSLPRYPEYKNSGIAWLGEIPRHWSTRPLKSIAIGADCAFIDGDWIESRHISDAGIRYITTGNVGPGFYKEQGEGYISDETFELLGCTEVLPGDVLISRLNAPIGRACLVPDLGSRVVTSVDNVIVRPSTAFDRQFLVFRLSSPDYFHEAGNLASGATMQRISRSELGNIRIAFPPLDEQVNIAAFLRRETAKIDALIAEQEKLIALLAEKRHATISHAVTRGLDPNAPMKDSGAAWLGEVPAHWGVGALTRIAERVVVGIAEAATHAYRDDGVPILRSTNVRAGRLVGEVLRIAPEFAAKRGSKLISAGDLVTVRTGNAGVTAVVPPELDQCQCFTMLITTLQPGHLPSYYCYWMNSEAAVRYFQLEGWGTAQVNISVPILKALPVAIPPLEEQEAIVDFLSAETDKVDTLRAAAERTIALLKERRSALIAAAVTGQIDVRGAVDVPARLEAAAA